MIQRARVGLPIPEIRKIAGLEAIDEALDARQDGQTGPLFTWYERVRLRNVRGTCRLSYVAKMAAQYDTRLIVTTRRPYIHPVASDIVKQSYLEAGRPEAFNPEDIRYVSEWQFVSHTAAVMGIFQREKPAANLLIGYWMAESLVLAEVGAQAGCIQIGANTNIFQIHFFIVTCDYTLIGEELFAASAYLSKDPMLTGTVVFPGHV